MSRSRYKIGENFYPYFLTCTVVGWLPLFSRPEPARIVLDSWRFLQEKQRMMLCGFVILENHVHLIASAHDLSKEVGDFKSFTARKIVDLLQERNDQRFLEELHRFRARHKTDREHQLWQEGSHPQMIQNEEMMRQKLDYIHYNPVRRGYLDEPNHWRYSSARNYARQESLLPVTMDW